MSDYALEEGFIQPSMSPYAAPILFMPKKDGGFIIWIDYRALNRITIKSRYPILRADELLNQLRAAKFFSKIDLPGGYHQIRVAAKDCHKTAFWTRYGRCAYLAMPFGLTNVLSTFQMTMNGISRELLDKCVIIYLDDILIYSKSKEQYLQELDACEFLKQELEFLGHIVSTEGVKIDPKKIQTIQEWKPPRNLKELKSFFGFINYVCHFIPNMDGLSDLRITIFFGGGRTSKLHLTNWKSPSRRHPSFASPILTIHTKSSPTLATSPSARFSNTISAKGCSQHFEVDKIIKTLKRHNYWPNMADNVRKCVSSCTACQIMKSSDQRAAGLLQP
ncbi:hypothetical protein CLOM_g9100 [Closterium sp. NIES-68]|nr:hypothetical protein CLOM_g9100 [Closterium sp. NIES-68]